MNRMSQFAGALGVIALAILVTKGEGEAETLATRNESHANETLDESSRRGAGHPSREISNGADAQEVKQTIVPSKRKLKRVVWLDTTTPVSRQYPLLREQAMSGEGGAAYALAQLLDSCQHTYRSDDEFNEALSRLRTKFELVTPGSSDPVPVRPEQVELLAQDLIKGPYERCQGVSKELLAEREHWLRTAAEHAVLPAKVQLATALGNSDEALSHWKDAWELGYADALSWIAKLYKEGSDNRLPNVESAYAYLHADARLYELFSRDSPGRDRDLNLQHYRETLKSASGELSPDQLKGAIAKGDTVLASNANCCYWSDWSW